jgi:citrate synthase
MSEAKVKPQVTPESVAEWWTSGVSDIAPNRIRLKGYAVEDLMGNKGFADVIWLLLRGELPTDAQRALLEAAMIGGVDHGPFAPSMAMARMAISCGGGLNNAIGTAVNVLGDIHGGAGEQAMEIYERVAARVKGGEALHEATKAELPMKIVPGFGHRFHKLDPRAPRLLALVEAAAKRGEVSGRYAAIGREVEKVLAAKIGKKIPMNVDGVTAVAFCELGFAPPLGRGLFCLARAVGACAHAWEEMQRGTRIKGPVPKEATFKYVGPPDREVP